MSRSRPEEQAAVLEAPADSRLADHRDRTPEIGETVYLYHTDFSRPLTRGGTARFGVSAEPALITKVHEGEPHTIDLVIPAEEELEVDAITTLDDWAPGRWCVFSEDGDPAKFDYSNDDLPPVGSTNVAILNADRSYVRGRVVEHIERPANRAGVAFLAIAIPRPQHETHVGWCQGTPKAGTWGYEDSNAEA
jgi:hypothetical protein